MLLLAPIRGIGPMLRLDAASVGAFVDFRFDGAQRAPVKAALLNQTVVAGIGNIYADESLHHSRIYPGRHAGDLSQGEIGRLRAAIRTVLSSAVETGGTSFAGYVNDFRGQKGYLDHAEVFRRQGQPCLVCGTVIVRTMVAGRATNFCPRCQQP